MPVINFINSPSISSNYSKDSEGHLHKRALILVEGTWKDSKKRTHTFDSDRIYRIAENTNALFQKGERIPLLEDHQKTQDKTIGDLNSEVEVREITEDDLPDGKHQHLVGKLGLFAEDVLVKSKRAIEQAMDGLLSTISPGVDILSDTIREISATPTPAIPGMSLFKRYDNAEFNALTWDQLESTETDFEPIKEQINELKEVLLNLLENIVKANEEELQGYSPEMLVQQALQDFSMRVMAVLGISGEGEEETAQQQSNEIMNRTTGQGYPYASYGSPNYVAAFSMADMADFMEEAQRVNPYLARGGSTPQQRLDRMAKDAKKEGFFGGIGRRARKTALNLGLTEKVPYQSDEYTAFLRNKKKGLTQGMTNAPQRFKKATRLTGRGQLALGGVAALGAMKLMKPKQEKPRPLFSRLF